MEEARKRLEAQIEKLEDETTETITIKRSIQPALIGAGGKYAIRLEEKYGVKLSFPRDNKDGAAAAKPDEVTIRGGKKGVAQVKAELLEAAAFETESRQELKFTVPTKSVAQVVGKSGSTINGIKDETGAQIDIDKTAGDDGKTTVTVRGSKDAITAAKKAVLAVVEEVGDEITISLTVDPKYVSHVTRHIILKLCTDISAPKPYWSRWWKLARTRRQCWRSIRVLQAGWSHHLPPRRSRHCCR